MVYSASTTLELLEQVVLDILTNRLDLNLVLHECATSISGKVQDCCVIPIGPTEGATSVVSALRMQIPGHVSLCSSETGQTQPGRRGPSNLRSSKIAIVGMSGRFPGASDVEEFWDVLQKGLDMHKEVFHIPSISFGLF